MKGLRRFGRHNRAIYEKRKKTHSFIPDEAHPLLNSVNTFWNLSEVILADGLLGHAEGTVSTASHAQVSTAGQRNK
ncbi:hypothetical protein F7725_006966 [Dissostichus mawsoni]|uniref:Uncharacterized protein n=1 Tax=Dissostichus mawsoni TaxID=36200 RepID=A0A7J5XVF6_DISMA|nr:hypothetical protein F7725_006966 [Dissostichus mawsoni]